MRFVWMVLPSKVLSVSVFFCHAYPMIKAYKRLLDVPGKKNTNLFRVPWLGNSFVFYVVFGDDMVHAVVLISMVEYALKHRMQHHSGIAD